MACGMHFVSAGDASIGMSPEKLQLSVFSAIYVPYNFNFNSDILIMYNE